MIIKIKIPNTVGIQIGARTHHQDQEITLQSFKTIKAIASKPLKPMPL